MLLNQPTCQKLSKWLDYTFTIHGRHRWEPSRNDFAIQFAVLWKCRSVTTVYFMMLYQLSWHENQKEKKREERRSAEVKLKQEKAAISSSWVLLFSAATLLLNMCIFTRSTGILLYISCINVEVAKHQFLCNTNVRDKTYTLMQQ